MKEINALLPSEAERDKFAKWGGVDPEQICRQLNNEGDTWEAKPGDVEKVLNQLFDVKPDRPEQPVDDTPADKDKVQSDIAFNRFCDEWFANYWANKPLIGEGIENVLAALSGKPVVLCGAGESVFDSLDLLWENKDKLIIVSVDHGWRFLPADVVFNVDSQNITYDRYFVSAWRRVANRLMVAQTYTNPLIARGWDRAGGILRWFHADYGDALPERWRDEQARIREDAPHIKPLGVHYTAFNTALAMLLMARASKVATVGCDYSWNRRYYFDQQPVEAAGSNFTNLTHDDKAMMLLGKSDEFDGQLYTTDKLQHMASTMIDTFSHRINAITIPRDDGATDIKFEKRVGLKMQFCGRPGGVLHPMVPFKDVMADYFVDDKPAIMEKARA